MWDWISNNSTAVQAVGTIIAIAVAIYVPWQQHRNDLARTRQQQQEERLLRMETAAAVAINAMNRIEEAWKGVVENPRNTMGYRMEGFDPKEFEQAREALHEINVANLPDSEMVQPILELRDLVVRAASLVDFISRAEQADIGDPDEGRESLDKVHELARRRTANIEAAVNRMKNAVKCS